MPGGKGRAKASLECLRTLALLTDGFVRISSVLFENRHNDIIVLVAKVYIFVTHICLLSV